MHRYYNCVLSTEFILYWLYLTRMFSQARCWFGCFQQLIWRIIGIYSCSTPSKQNHVPFSFSGPKQNPNFSFSRGDIAEPCSDRSTTQHHGDYNCYRPDGHHAEDIKRRQRPSSATVVSLSNPVKQPSVSSLTPLWTWGVVTCLIVACFCATIPPALQHWSKLV